MRSLHSIFVAFLLSSAPRIHILAQSLSPFCSPLQQQYSPDRLFRRQPCPIAYIQCTALGSNGEGACCENTQTCAYDDAQQVACCPIGYTCTGTVPQDNLPVDSTTVSDSTSSVDTTATSTVNYSPATVTTTATLTQTQPASPGSTVITPTPTPTPVTGPTTYATGLVPNTYFPFAYIPGTFVNAAQCTQAWSTCQVQSTQCFLSLAARNGVSVSAPYGGTTVIAATGDTLAAVSSICNSLSSVGCHNLQLASCATVIPSNNGAAGLLCKRLAYAAAGGGAMAGVVGAVI